MLLLPLPESALVLFIFADQWHADTLEYIQNEKLTEKWTLLFAYMCFSFSWQL